MPTATESLELVRRINASAAFNVFAGIDVVAAGDGRAEIRIPWREHLGQYAGFLHAAIVSGLIDTACGFAAVTVSGRVLATHCAVNFLAPGIGTSFVARAHVVRAGRRQVFASAQLHALRDGAENLIATGETLLLPVPD